MKKIGIITALDTEAEDYIETFELQLVKEYFGIKLYQGQTTGYEISLIISSCGKVNAAYATKLLIDFGQIDYILHSGIAGGIGDGIQPLDLVIANTLTYHDVDYQQMLDFPPFQPHFMGDEALSKKIKQHAQSLNFNIKIGTIISGDSFIADHDIALSLAKTYHAEMVDMESAAVAQICTIENIPLVVLRCASDNASDDANHLYEQNEKSASSLAATVFISAIKQKII